MSSCRWDDLLLGTLSLAMLPVYALKKDQSSLGFTQGPPETWGGLRGWVVVCMFSSFLKFTSLTYRQITNHVIFWVDRQRLQCFLFFIYLGWRRKNRLRRGPDLWRGLRWRRRCWRRLGGKHEIKTLPQAGLRGLQAEGVYWQHDNHCGEGCCDDFTGFIRWEPPSPGVHRSELANDERRKQFYSAATKS